MRRLKWIGALIVCNVLAVSTFLGLYPPAENFQGGLPEFVQVYENVDELMPYAPDAENVWCNTVVIPFHALDARIMAFPPEIGKGVIFDTNKLTYALRSHYMLLSDRYYGIIAPASSLELLNEYPDDMKLYKNLNVECP